MNLDSMHIESPLAARRDWGRIGYWTVKFFTLLALLALVAFAAWAAWTAITWSWSLAVAALDWINTHFIQIKRAFYSLTIAAIFFYTARAIRAGALWIEARARKEKSK